MHLPAPHSIFQGISSPLLLLFSSSFRSTHSPSRCSPPLASPCWLPPSFIHCDQPFDLASNRALHARLLRKATTLRLPSTQTPCCRYSPSSSRPASRMCSFWRLTSLACSGGTECRRYTSSCRARWSRGRLSVSLQRPSLLRPIRRTFRLSVYSPPTSAVRG